MEWVSIKKSYPLGQEGFKGLPVLIAWDDGTVESGWYCGEKRFQHADGDMDYHREEKVTHWMYLPKHPNFCRNNL